MLPSAVKLLHSDVCFANVFSKLNITLCIAQNITMPQGITSLGRSQNFTECCLLQMFMAKYVRIEGADMSESKLRTQSMDFTVSIIQLVKYLKGKRESIISNQIGRRGLPLEPIPVKRMAKLTLLQNYKLRLENAK